jgi:ABC-type antimicrobial peptide transport system permease subunit
VTPSFFAVTKQRLLSGRLLDVSDDNAPATAPTVVVNDALMQRDFHGRDPVGKRFHVNVGDTSYATIVGVVSDIRNFGPVSAPKPEMYWTYGQGGNGNTAFPLMIRVKSANPAAVVSGVRDAIRATDPTAAVSAVSTMPEVIARSLGPPRFYFSLLGTFAAVAMSLAVAGLYGVLSYAVAQRTREIGIRAALGSPRGRLVRLTVREGAKLIAAGIALGSVGGLVVTRLMTFMLYSVSPLDATTWMVAILLLAFTALSATLVPGYRAARVDPLIAMRVE